jgi:hypothetical protein
VTWVVSRRKQTEGPTSAACGHTAWPGLLQLRDLPCRRPLAAERLRKPAAPTARPVTQRMTGWTLLPHPCACLLPADAACSSSSTNTAQLWEAHERLGIGLRHPNDTCGMWGPHLGGVHRPQAGPHNAVHVGAAGGGMQLQQLRQLLRVHRLGQAARLQTKRPLPQGQGHIPRHVTPTIRLHSRRQSVMSRPS